VQKPRCSFATVATQLPAKKDKNRKKSFCIEKEGTEKGFLSFAEKKCERLSNYFILFFVGTWK
jgi:hypothetical protein